MHDAPRLQCVAVPGVWAGGLCFAVKRQVDALAVGAHPPDLPGRHAGHEREIGHVARNHGPGGDKGEHAYRHATDDGAIRAKRRAFPDTGIAVFGLALDEGTRVVDIGKDHRRAAENALFQNYVVIDGHIVLYLAVVADFCVVPDEAILPQRDIPADFRACADMRKMPDAAALADLRAVVDDGGRMDADGHQANLPIKGCIVPRRVSGVASRIVETVSMATRFSSTPKPRPASIPS